MKVLQINTVYGEGSTGLIAKAIHDLCADYQIRCISAHRCVQKGKQPLEDSISISSKWGSRLHGLLSRFTMFKGAGSVIKTARFLKQVSLYAPDVIHLHNLHGSYINLPLLFRYIKKHNIPVVWTLHDCWAFTAICSHFTIVGCKKWRSGCHNCPQKKRFSSAPIDLSRFVWKVKKTWFTGIPQAVVVTPSHWLEGLVRESFLGGYQIQTIYNGIDLTTFTETESDFRADYGLENKKIVLGVAFDWSYAKGLDVFLELSKRLSKDYQIVLVGTNPEIDRILPDCILSIHRTKDQHTLAAVYTAADVFVNPTREEVLGLVNIEALACSTPVITFDTGGSPECISSTCGVIVPKDDVDTMEREIIRICTQKPYRKQDCRDQAMRFDKKQCLKQYLDLYRKISGKNIEKLQ